MTAPRLEIDLEKIHHNALTLVTRLHARGISATGVTKACMGDLRLAKTFLRAGIGTLADSRIENIRAMRRGGITSPLSLIRSPMQSQADSVVAHADVSFNTELDVIGSLSAAAGKSGRRHGVLLMVELGDLREGILPGDLEAAVRQTRRFPNIDFKGIGANFACRSGVVPDTKNLSELSRLADSIDVAFGPVTDLVSGGNSANLPWAFNCADVGRINDLRLGESILLGLDPIHRCPIADLHTDAITFIAEAIESKSKPSLPWGKIAHAAFDTNLSVGDRGTISQTILAAGHQDIDPDGLVAPEGTEIIGSSSDHLILDAGSRRISVGSEVSFKLNYSALLRAMTSPFVRKYFLERNSLHQFPSMLSGPPRFIGDKRQWH